MTSGEDCHPTNERRWKINDLYSANGFDVIRRACRDSFGIVLNNQRAEAGEESVIMTLPVLRTKRLQTALVSLAVLTAAIGLVITPVEKKFGQLTTFQTTGDGLWWAVTTVTSVGYGDYYPVTTPGRILGAILEVAGVTIFGIIIALVTVELFRSEQIFYWKRTVERFDRLEKKLDVLQKEQGFNIKSEGKPGQKI